MSQEDATEEEKKDGQATDQNTKMREKREKNAPPTKVVIRRLPPTMNEETFIEQVSPLQPYDYLYFVKGDLSLGQYSFSRAYINFVCQDDIFTFTEQFDGYVFVDQKGNEFPAVVEFAPFQKIPKRSFRKRDSKCGTIESDPDYVRFLELCEKGAEPEAPPSTTQETLEEIEAKERELRANHGVLKTSTPLLDYIRQRKEERVRIREEKKEERRRREVERRKVKEEERRRPPRERDMKEGGKDTKDKQDRKGDKTSKQITIHKDKDGQNIDKELTQKLKEVLKINTSTEKSHPKNDSGDSSLEKDARRDRSHRESEHKGRLGNRDREQPKDKEKDKEHLRVRTREREKAEYMREKEKERIKRREELKARKEEEKSRKGPHKSAALESGDKSKDSRNTEPTSKETKSYQSIREERQRQMEARAAARAKQGEAGGGSSLATQKSSGFAESKNDDGFVTKSNTKQDILEKDHGGSSKRESELQKSADPQRNKPEAPSKVRTERIRNKVGVEQSGQGKAIKNKDRPSMQIYRPGMLKRGASASGNSSEATGSKQGSGPDSTSTSSSSSPTPGAKGEMEGKPQNSTASSLKKNNSREGKVKNKDIEQVEDSPSKDKNEDVPVKSMTFKRSVSKEK